MINIHLREKTVSEGTRQNRDKQGTTIQAGLLNTVLQIKEVDQPHCNILSKHAIRKVASYSNDNIHGTDGVEQTQQLLLVSIEINTWC